MRAGSWLPRRSARPPHLVIGVSDPSDDPSRHRAFHIAASYDVTAGGWCAAITEENANAQPGPWLQRSARSHRVAVAPTAAACLGRAVELIVSVIASDADASPPEPGP